MSRHWSFPHVTQIEHKRKGEKVHKKFDWGDLAISFGAGFLVCFLFGVYLLSR